MAQETRRKVLVIDDDPDVRDIVGITLKREGITVFFAEDGEEGLVKARSEEPDCIILDILMPKKDGLSTYEELLKEKKLSNVPVVILTSVSDKVGFGFSSDTMKEYYGKKPAAFLEKPLDPDKLIKIVRDFLKIGR